MATLIAQQAHTTTIGTETTLCAAAVATPEGAASFVAKLSLINLAAGEVAIVRLYDTVQSPTNLITADQSSFETDTAAVTTSNCTVAQTATQHLDGSNSLQMTASSAANISATSAQTLQGSGSNPEGTCAVLPGISYRALAAFRTAVTARSCTVTINWVNNVGNTIASTTGIAVTNSTSGWVFGSVIGVAPPGAYGATIQVTVQSPANTEVHYTDCWAIAPLGGNLLASQDASPTAVGDWVAGSNCSVSAVTTPTFSSLHSLQMSSTASGTMTANLGVSGTTPVVANQQYTAIANLETGASARTVSVGIQWMNAAGGTISTSTGNTATDATTGWTAVSVTATAPATAVSAVIIITVQSTGGAAELHYVGGIGLYEGTNTQWSVANNGSISGGWNIGGVEQLAYTGTFIGGSDGDPVILLVPIPVDMQARLAILQKNGSARTIPWRLYQL